MKSKPDWLELGIAIRVRMESTNDGTVHQMHIKHLAGYEPSLPITYYKKLKKVTEGISKEVAQNAEQAIASAKSRHPHLRNWEDDIKNKAISNQSHYIRREQHNEPKRVEDDCPLDGWKLSDGKLNRTGTIDTGARNEFNSLNVRPRGCFYYPQGAFKEWHTNANQPGWRGYCVSIDQTERSSFIYIEPETKAVVELNDKNMHVNMFKVPETADAQIWHAVKSDCNRVSLGFLLNDQKKLEKLISKYVEFDQNKEILEHIEYLFESGFWNIRWGTKTLIDHLTEVCKIMFTANRPKKEYLAGLYHSVYETEKFKHGIAPSREAIRRRIGEEAEELVYAFCNLKQRDKRIAEKDIQEKRHLESLAWISLSNRLDGYLDHPAIKDLSKLTSSYQNQE